MLEALEGDGAVDGAVSDDALIRAMLDVEAALARALERAGLVDGGCGESVTTALAGLSVDAADLGRAALASGNPVVPLVAQACAVVPETARAAVHLGATSQDVLDTALMLCASRALVPLQQNLSRAGAAAARLAADHRSTPMVARTLGQPALPTTFGLKAANWLAGIEASSRRLSEIDLAVQLGGAAGTLAAYGDDGLHVGALLAAELGLAEARIPWHTERSRVHLLGAALASVVTAAGKVATDVLLMSQAEVGEVVESTPGRSSAMPHKRNPVGSVLLVSSARRAPGFVAMLFASGLHEHERATGSWHAEWQPLRSLLRLAGGSAARVAEVLEGLQVDPVALRRNLDGAGPGVMSEAYAGELIPTMGRARAQEAAREAALEAERHDEPLRDPTTYLGSAEAIVDRVLGARSGIDVTGRATREGPR